LGYVTDRFSVVGFVENAFDEQYFTATSDNGFLSGVGIQPSRRTYGIRVNVHTGE
jgi:outer membrane receptor protein involved in Fe transport